MLTSVISESLSVGSVCLFKLFPTYVNAPGAKVVKYMVECCVKKHKMIKRELTAHVSKGIVAISRNALVDWIWVNRPKYYKPCFKNSQTLAQMIALEKWSRVHSTDHCVDCIHANEFLCAFV